MSYSQASDTQYEVSQYTDSFLDPGLFQSDNFPQGLSSEIITQSTLFFSPSLPQYPPAPTSLQRVGRPFQASYILYNSNKSDPMMESSRNKFVEWWLKTEFGLQKDLQKSIIWNSESKKSDVWKSFDQVAHSKTGEPKVMCKRCQAVVVHPGYYQAGPSPMGKHLASTQCSKPHRPPKQGIDKLLRDMVSLSLI